MALNNGQARDEMSNLWGRSLYHFIYDDFVTKFTSFPGKVPNCALILLAYWFGRFLLLVDFYNLDLFSSFFGLPSVKKLVQLVWCSVDNHMAY